MLGNNHVCSIRGRGSIRLRLNDQSIILLSDISFIPEVKRNLISLGVLESKGYGFISDNGHLRIYKGSAKIMNAVRKKTLYYLDATVVSGVINATEKASDDFRIWHQRMGHLGEKGMKELVKRGLIKARGEADLKKCEQCVMGKGKKLPFPKGKLYLTMHIVTFGGLLNHLL